MFRRIWFAFAYRFTKPRWDTGITPPEVVDLIEKRKLPPGRALDLGCGTGTNVLYLASHGWKVVGVDFVGQAIETAKRKAKQSNVNVEFFHGDVTQLDFLFPPFDFALDIGCFHSIPVSGRSPYISGLSRLVRPGGIFLCYAFKPEAPLGGLAVEEMQNLFGSNFESVKVEHGQGTPSAWYTFVRK